MTTTTTIRAAIVQRLLALGSSSASNIGAVCNPEQVRNPENRAALPQLTAVIWTMPGQLLAQQGNKMKWQQPFTIDIAVPWDNTAEARCDQMRLELANALLNAASGLTVQKQTLSDLEIGYPAEGSSYALVSATVTLEYIETI